MWGLCARLQPIARRVVPATPRVQAGPLVAPIASICNWVPYPRGTPLARTPPLLARAPPAYSPTRSLFGWVPTTSTNATTSSSPLAPFVLGNFGLGALRVPPVAWESTKRKRISKMNKVGFCQCWSAAFYFFFADSGSYLLHRHCCLPPRSFCSTNSRSGESWCA